MMPLDVRPATHKDAGIIFNFVTELAIYEKAEHEVLATVETVESSIFGPNSTVYALICEKDGQAIGFAVYFFNYSTWLAKNGLYLEDLYVTPSARGVGAGKALMKRLAQIAVEKDCGRFEWSVLDWNTPAIDFYERIGATHKDGWYIYQMAGDRLKEFAAS